MLIAIVDDTPVNLTLMSRLIETLGDHEIHTFESPAEGLAWCTTHPFDLLILDYMMPDLDGLGFLARLREYSAVGTDAPVLMVTANDDVEVRHKALAGGASDFLTKPIDRVEFLARIRNMLALRESTQALRDRASWLDGEVRKATKQLLLREREAIVLLSRAAEYRDPETGGHIQRMAHYSRLIAEELGLSTAEQEVILAVAPMHDIGKVGTPDNILLKPGKLTAEEMVTMREHAQNGYDILKASRAEMLQIGADIAQTHHEMFDGKGYPKGLAGEAIPLVGRIVAVADVFDALTSVRPYKPAWSLERSRELLETNRGTHFDPRCVDAFLHRWADVLAIRDRFKDEH